MSRIEVLKTYKIYIGGQFPRTESGRYYQPQEGKIGNICLSSRKDFRNAVAAARGAQAGWGAKSAYNRSQILYRIAEMLEGRRAQFEVELQSQGIGKTQAIKEVDLSIDRLIYYAGWCDKYTQIFSSVNPVASSHFNFSAPEATGVVSIIAPEKSSLLGLITQIAPTIAGGNTCIVLASESNPLCAISFAEVINSSDVPGGVVNILTGSKKELINHFASHMDVNAIIYCGDEEDVIKEIQLTAIENLKRVIIRGGENYSETEHENPYYISDILETKTTWHPIEIITGAGSGY